MAYFAPDAPDFQEAGELKGDDLATALRILNGSSVPTGNPVQLEWNRSIQAIFKRVIMPFIGPPRFTCAKMVLSSEKIMYRNPFFT